VTAPEAPENVRVELRDGRTVPCELAYEGWVDGAHRWVAVTPVDLDQIVALRADVIPGHTAIVIGGTR
jgi:hypothetical protein